MIATLATLASGGLEALTWVDCDDSEGYPGARLLSAVTLAGAAFHVELVRVRDDAEGAQRAESPHGQSRIDAVGMEWDACQFATVEFRGAPYVLLFCPFDR